MTTHLPEKISADDLAYHRKLNATVNSAQAMFQHWASHLVEKYAIGQQDQLKEDGTIERGKPDAPPAEEK